MGCLEKSSEATAISLMMDSQAVTKRHNKDDFFPYSITFLYYFASVSGLRFMLKLEFFIAHINKAD